MPENIVAAEFNAKAGEYESNRLADWYKAHAEEIAKHSPALASGDVLDIGCATGYQLRRLADLNPNSKLVGIDLAAEMISQAKRISPESDRFHFVCDNWELLSPQTADLLKQFNFKLIICANTLHYFLDPQQAVRQMYDQLDTGGTLLILEREKSNSLLTSIWGGLHRHFIKDQVEFYAADEIKQLLQQIGFQQTDVASTIVKYFWKGKLFTSIALVKGEK